MKTFTFTTIYNSKSAKLVADIIASEELEVAVYSDTNAIGDDIIIVTGEKEEIEVMKQIFKMVY